MTTTPKIAWIGLGAMGAPMALATAEAGMSVTAYDVSPDSLKAVESHLSVASNAREAVTGADVVAIMVATGAQLDSVLFGDDGVASELKQDTVVLVMATVGPQAIESAAARLEDVNVRVVDAPVSGGVARAKTGDLLIMVGGEVKSV